MLLILRCLCLATLCLVATPLAAHAQFVRSPEPYDPYETSSNFNWRHGNVSMSAIAGIAGKSKLAGTSLDLDLTLGVIGRYEKPINRYMALGGGIGIEAWVPSLSSNRGAGRSTLFDLVFLGKLRYPFSDRFEIYIEAPVGFCGSIPDNRNFGGVGNIAGGYTLMGLGGTHIGLSPSTGLVLEGGYAWHWFTEHVQRVNTSVRYTVDVALHQPMLLIGFYARN